MRSNIEGIRQTQSLNYAKNILLILAGSLFLALLSQVQIPLLFTPVPMSMQTFGVLLLGALLGSKRGALAVCAYLAEGLIGFPVFAGGALGIAAFAGTTFGYLIGFIVSAYLVGLLLEKKSGYLYTMAALTAGLLTILGLGTLWLSLFVGMKKAFFLGAYPFLLGECVKVVLVTASLPLIKKGRSLLGK